MNNGDYTLKYTYSTAGAAVGVRTKAKQGVTTTNTLHYLYSDHLGSTSVVTNSSGGQVKQTRFLPFGGYWGTPTQTVTDRGYTGHLHNDEVGLIYMNARFYVPWIGRFASADTIVPNPTNPQAFNRYSYVKNNPLNRVDPTGHVDCGLLGGGEDSAGCEEAKNTPTSKPRTPQQALPPQLPERPEGISDKTWNTYVTMWEHFKDSSYILPDGRLTDLFLLAILIRVEFNGLISDTAIYNAALEALSNQYRGYGCQGACSSLGQQLKWLNVMQGWYGRNGKLILIDDCPRCLGDADRVLINGVNDKDGKFAWWWGNPTANSAMTYYIDNIDSSGRINPSWGTEYTNGAFIIQSSIPGSGTYSKFLVVTFEQNLACGTYPGPISCMGFPYPKD